MGARRTNCFYCYCKYWVNNHAHVLRPNREKILDEILVALINEMDLTHVITGITVPKLTQQKLVELTISLPPIDVQKQIVAEIEEEQKAVDNCKQLIVKYEQKIKSKIAEVWGEKE